jgi:hypothetical protein
VSFKRAFLPLPLWSLLLCLTLIFCGGYLFIAETWQNYAQWIPSKNPTWLMLLAPSLSMSNGFQATRMGHTGDRQWLWRKELEGKSKGTWLCFILVIWLQGVSLSLCLSGTRVWTQGFMYKAGALPLEPHLQPILLWLFWRWGLKNYLPGLTSNLVLLI